MKKILTILTLGLALFLVGCSSNKPEEIKPVVSAPVEAEAEEETKVEEVKKDPLDALKEEFKNKGFEVGENEIIAFEMMGATNGNKYKINGELIEVYTYDESKLTTEGKKQFEQAKNGSISMSGFNIEVSYINGFVLTRLSEHKDKDKIIEVVKNFKN